MVFNKTTVIIDPLRPSLFVKKTSHISKPTFFQLSIFASSFFCFFSYFMFFGVYFKKHMFHASIGPLGLSLRPNLASASAREGQSLLCFCMFLDRDSFSQFLDLFNCFPSCLAPLFIRNGIQKLPFARRRLPFGAWMLHFWLNLNIDIIFFIFF
jgi:hypothetical protein